MILSVTLSRESLSLADLVITNDPTADITLLEEGFARPGFTMRRTYAPDSAWVGGRQLLAAVVDASTLPLVFNINGSSAANAEALIDEVEAAVTQFAYDVTLSIDGQAHTWLADPELPSWTADSGMVRAHMVRGSVVIPVNPA